MKLELDKTDEIKSVFDKVVEDYEDIFGFVVENAIFQFTFRENPTFDEDGQPIAATAHKLNNRERDLYGSDFEIQCHRETWDYYDEDQKERLIFHELLHCQVAEDEESPGDPAYDKDGRIVTWIAPHDIITKTFSQEIEQFGLKGSDLEVARFMHDMYEKHLAQKSKKLSKKKIKRK